MRGRGGTEWASSNHGVGDLFCVIEFGAQQPLILPSWSIGTLATVTVQNSATASATISAESLRPPQPVNVTAAVQPTGDLEINWRRRSRAAWVDEVDVPLGEHLGEMGVLRGTNVVLGGQQVVGTRVAAISSASGGTTVDSQARLVIDQILAAMRQHGLIET